MNEFEHEYSAEHLQVYEFDEGVRHRPAMYFRVGQGNPRLPTEVLAAVVGHVLHPATAVAPVHTGRIEAVVLDDLTFSVTDDLDDETADPGYLDTLIAGWRYLAAAAAALSTRTVVEVWRDGSGFRQELAGMKPASDPTEFDAPPGTGTRMTFELDVEFAGAGSVITHELDGLDFHGPDCYPTPGSAPITLTDRRLLH